MAEKSGQSAHFEQVSKKLQLGGHVYVYADIDGDLEKLSDTIKDWIDQLKKQDPDLDLPPIPVRKILQHLGLGGIQSIGLSSVKNGAIFHNRAFIGLANPRKGILGMYGDKPLEFRIAQNAPADADLVAEGDIYLQPLWETSLAILNEFPQGAEVANKLNEALGQSIPGLALTYKQLVDHGNLHTQIVFRINSEKILSVPGEEFKFPLVEFMLGLDKMEVVFKALKERLQQIPFAKVEDNEKWEMLVIALPIGGDLAVYQPVLALNKASGQLVLATNKTFLEDCFATQDRLAQSPIYQKAILGLPLKGNGLYYGSPKLYKKIKDFFSSLAAIDEEFKVAETIFGLFVTHDEVASAGIRVNQSDGIYTASNDPYSHKLTLMVASFYNPFLIGILAAVAIPNFLEYKRKAETISQQ
jgi:hypothetical protein